MEVIFFHFHNEILYPFYQMEVSMKGTKTTLGLLLSALAMSAIAGQDFNGLPLNENIFKTTVPQVAPKASWSSWLPSKAGFVQGAKSLGSFAKSSWFSTNEKIASYIPIDRKTAGIYGGAIGAGLATGYAIQKGVIGKTSRLVKAGYQKTANGIKAINQKYPKAKWAVLATGAVTAVGICALAYRNPELVKSVFDIARTFGSQVADIAVKAGNLVVDNKYPVATFAGSATVVPGFSFINRWYQNRKPVYKAQIEAIEKDITAPGEQSAFLQTSTVMSDREKATYAQAFFTNKDTLVRTAFDRVCSFAAVDPQHKDYYFEALVSAATDAGCSNNTVNYLIDTEMNRFSA